MEFLTNPAFADLISAFMQLMVAAFVGLAAMIYRRAFNKDLDKQAQETLHSALSTGAHMAWSRFFGAGLVDRSAMMQVTLDHVMGDGASDSVKRLDVSTEGLMKLAEAKLMEVGVKYREPTGEVSP